MGEKTKIEWCHHTGNLWWGCQEVHVGCDHCYARQLDARYKGGHWGASAPRRPIKSVWADFLKWQRLAQEAGEMHRVFVGSMMDIFELDKPLFPILQFERENLALRSTSALREKFFREIVPQCPNLLFLLLTKRPGNIKDMVPRAWLETPPPNVMYGYSAVNQETADRDIPKLLDVPGRHFLSCEPLLEPVDLSEWLESCERCCGEGRTFACFDPRGNPVDGMPVEDAEGRSDGIVIDCPWCAERRGYVDWVIVGGESGGGARPCHTGWILDIVRQCRMAGVPVFVKQLGAHALDYGRDFGPAMRLGLRDRKGGEMSEWPSALQVRDVPSEGGAK